MFSINPIRTLARAALLLASAAALADAPATQTSAPPRFAPLSLTLLHVNDHHSQLDTFANAELRIGGVATRVDWGGFARLSSAFARHAQRADVIKLHAGDAITGTLYHTLFRGAADAALMNTVCFDALVPGNHEFNDGDAGLQEFLQHLHAGACQTPVLAANVHPRMGTPLAPRGARAALQPYTIKTIGGVPVAIIGIVAKEKTLHSSRPLPSTVFEDEAQAAQRTIDLLKARGLRHFVLLTHQGYRADKALAARLSDVDAIVGGDSHSLLGDFSALGLSSAGPYPTRLRNRDGQLVCVVQAWEFGKAIGELDLQFNERGEVERCTGQTSLLIGSNFQRQNSSGAFVPVDAATRKQIIESLRHEPGLLVLEPDPAAALKLAGFAAQLTEKKTEIIGRSTHPLCLVRVPGEQASRSAGVPGCEAAHTLARGSDAAQIVAAAFLARSPAADLAIQNAGGVRMPIAAGPLSLGAAFGLLPFNNVLVELRLSGQQIIDTLEEAVSHHQDAGQSSGSHPYAAGLRWRLDLSQPRGARFSAVQVRERTSGVWRAIDIGRSYTVVTNDFIASGKDGYATFGAVFAGSEPMRSTRLYTQAFIDYVRARGVLERPDASDYSHQSVITAAGLELP